IPASMTKTMTAFVAFELIEDGKLSPTRAIAVDPKTAEEWSGKGSTMWLEADRPIAVSDMLTGIMTVSANDASIALAQGVSGSVPAWTELMNKNARMLGMTDSHFGTPNGWPDDGRTFTTARDLATLAEALIKRHPVQFARYIGQPTFSWNEREQINRDPLLGRIEGADGIKTGFTNEAGHSFLGTAKQGEQRLVIVLAGTRSEAARAQLARDYIAWGFSEFDRERLIAKNVCVGTARVQGGTAREVNLITDREILVNVPRGRRAEMQVSIRYDGPVRAPFKAGEEVATLEVMVPGMEPARVPLLAGETVEKAGLFSRIWNGIAGWF
ncbi:MAG: D-alanyl-D-alanine carboxypeptidase family protein, partial [Marinomonas sp.]